MTGAEGTEKPVTSMTSMFAMRRAAIGVAILLLLARSGVGQEPPPLTVETLKPVPTVVKSGEPFLQVYRVRFPDLIGEGRELMVLEDRMVPENVTVNPFEAISVNVAKRRVGDEHIWDFAYTLRLVDPAKGTYLVPSISFFWLLRDLGATIEDSEVRLVNTDEMFVSYVTTVTEDLVIDIRDAVELGSFTTRATVLKVIAWTVAPLPLVVWLVMLVKLMRRAEACRAGSGQAGGRPRGTSGGIRTAVSWPGETTAPPASEGARCVQPPTCARWTGVTGHGEKSGHFV